MTLKDKYESLQGILRDLGRVVVAYSGGVDSTFLLKAAVDTLGSDKSYDLRDVYIRWALSQMRLTDHHSDWFGDFAAWSIMLVLPILNAMKAADD